MVKKETIILLVLYFLQFYLTGLRGRDYFVLTNSQGPFFRPLGDGAGVAQKNTRSRSCLGKKSRVGAA